MGYPTFRYRNINSVVRAPGFVAGLWRQGQTGQFGPAGIGRTVINSSGSDIAADALVAVVGFDTTTQLPKIVLANNSTAGHNDIYVTPAIIHNGKTGIVIKGGKSGKTLNANGGAPGTAIYLDSNAGGFTSTAPLGGASTAQIVGYILTQSASVGQVLWDIQSVQTIGNNDLNPATLQFLKVNVPRASVVAMQTSAVVVVAAPGAGKFLVVSEVALGLNYDGTNAFSSGGVVTVQYSGGSVVHAGSFATSFVTGTSNALSVAAPITATLSIPVNTGITVTNATGLFVQASGSSSLDVFVWYTVQSS